MTIEDLIRETLAEDAQRHEPGPDMWAGVLKRSQRPLLLRRRARLPLAAAAAAVLMVLMAIGFMANDGPGTRIGTRPPAAESPEDLAPPPSARVPDPEPPGSAEPPTGVAPGGGGRAAGPAAASPTPTQPPGPVAKPSGLPTYPRRDPGPPAPRRYLDSWGDYDRIVFRDDATERILAGGNDSKQYFVGGLTADLAVYVVSHIKTVFDTDIVLTKLDGTGAVETIRNTNAPLLSGDDRRLAYIANNGSAMTDIVIRDLDTGAEKRYPLRDNPWGYAFPSDFPALTAFAGRHLVMEEAGPNGAREIWSLDTAHAVSLREARRISGGGYANVAPFDTTTFVVAVMNDNSQLVYMDAATGEVKRRQSINGGIPGALRGDGRTGVYCVRRLDSGESEMRALSQAGSFDVVATTEYDGEAEW